ncbi:MAG: UDP-glucose 4-epimerase GalE [Caulobacteraceae bacterium]
MMGEAAVLVTGGAGYIGSHMVMALIEAGRRVVVADDLSVGARAAIPQGVAFSQGNIGDPAFVSGLFARDEIGAVVHFAGSISGPESILDPAKYYANNTAASLVLARACIRAGVGHFVFSSSAAIYGAAACSPIAETAPARPSTPYGASKLMTEVMLGHLAAASPAFRPICLRYFNVAGFDPEGKVADRAARPGGLIPLAVEVALGRREHLPIWGDDYDTRDGTGERDYVHVSDLARAHVLALNHLDAGGAPVTLNCGYGRGHTVLEVVAALEAILGRALPTRRAPRRIGDAASAVSDIGRLRATLDWRPRFDDLETILRSALAHA